MPENSGTPLGRFADAVRKQLHDDEEKIHELDLRVTKIEAKEKYKGSYGNLFWKIVGVVLVAAALVVSIIALRHTI